MINYSVILLGATISVSLYIRLCVVCSALEVNSGLDNNKKYFQQLSLSEQVQLVNGIDPDPLAHYREDYLRILKGDVVLHNSIGIKSEDVDDFVEHRLTYLKNAPSATKDSRVVAKHHLGDEFYDEQICGIMHHNSPYRFDEDEGMARERVITDGSAPPGCYYEDIDKQNLACKERDMRVVPKLPVKLFRLHISGTKIQEVNKTNFGDVSITNIQLEQNEISEIQPWAFSNVKNIGTLEIMDNSLAYLAFDIYFGLKDVYALHLDGNQISFSIYENCTARPNVSEIPNVLPKLRILTLNRNPLKIIPEQMWAGLRDSELGMLELARCGLEFIHEVSFTFLPRLKILDLTANPGLMPNLATAFKGLRNGSLEILYLGDNGLYRFPTEALSLISESLMSLDMSGNPITYLDRSDLPSNLNRLRTLNLARCMLIEIQSGALNLIPTLLTLNLEQNYLTRLPEMTALAGLQHLNINDNIIVIPDHRRDDNGGGDRRFAIDDFAFANLTNLRQLMLVGTEVKFLLRHTLTGLTKLESLFLDNSGLEKIADEAFEGLESLKNLYMSNNPKLTTLNSLTFYGLQNLQHLNLAECGINFRKYPTSEENENTTTSGSTTETMDQDVESFVPDYFKPFMFLSSLEKLDLSNNSITELYPELFSENMKIAQLLFSGNKIKSWSAPLLQNNYTQRRIATYPNKTLETMFFLSTNGLSFITDAMIADIISFQAFQMDLSKNAFMCDKGACALRDLMVPPNDNETDFGDKSASPLPSGIIKFHNMESYTCLDIGSDTLIPIINVTNEMCLTFNRSGVGSDSETTIFEESNWTTIIIASTVSFAGIITIAAVGYKQRAHIRYWIFRAQLNVSLPQSAKSRSLADLIQYDFDIFVSYHNEDRNFIVDKFLPEVEDPGFRADVSHEENKILDLELGHQKSSTGFRVCLHERDFEAGLPITENILDSVDRSKKIVIVISKKYLESQWCTFEMNLAYHRLVESRRNSFVVIILEEIPANLRTKVLNYLMRSRTYLEWPGENATPQEITRFWTRLRSSFKADE